MSQPVSAATDIFAAGAVFYQFATGVHPFSGKNKSLPELLTAIMSQDPLPLSVAAPDAPLGLNDVLLKALRKKPQERWQNANQFKAALSACRNTQAAPKEEVDPTKTRVMSQAVIAELKKRQPIPPPPPPEKPLPEMHRRFCPQCTHANSVNALQCSRCGAPLVNTPEGGAINGSRKNSLPLYLVGGLLAGLLILLLILVLVLSRRA
jgi:serine/threonine protein kinase